MPRKSDEAILQELRDVAAELESVNADRDALYLRRKKLFAAGRKRTPPIWLRVMGEAAGVGEIMVLHALKEKE